MSNKTNPWVYQNEYDLELWLSRTAPDRAWGRIRRLSPGVWQWVEVDNEGECLFRAVTHGSRVVVEKRRE